MQTIIYTPIHNTCMHTQIKESTERITNRKKGFFLEINLEKIYTHTYTPFIHPHVHESVYRLQS